MFFGFWVGSKVDGTLRTLRSPELLCLTGTPNTTVEAGEWYNLLVLLHVTQVPVRLGQLHPCTLH